VGNEISPLLPLSVAIAQSSAFYIREKSYSKPSYMFILNKF